MTYYAMTRYYDVVINFALLGVAAALTAILIVPRGVASDEFQKRTVHP